MTHVRTRLAADFTVMANALAQRRGSAVTVGVAAYILSLPDGAPVTVAALCAHFSEGEILISRALRELEAAGYLERRRVRDERGAIRTRTFFYAVPAGERPTPPEPPEPDGPPEPPVPPTPAGARKPEAADLRAPRPAPVPLPGPAVGPEPAPAARSTAPSTPASTPPDADPRAVALLASLRVADPRLVLSRREAATLAPAVEQWLTAGVEPAQLTKLLTVRLPEHFLARPARILAYRLKEPPLPAPSPAAALRPPAVLPWQTCDGGCDRPFRAARPGTCRDCRAAAHAPSAAA